MCRCSQGATASCRLKELPPTARCRHSFRVQFHDDVARGIFPARRTARAIDNRSRAVTCLSQYVRVLLVSLLLATPAAVAAEPKVLIIGDSISLGYTPVAEKLLAGKAEVRHNSAKLGQQVAKALDAAMKARGLGAGEK